MRLVECTLISKNNGEIGQSGNGWCSAKKYDAKKLKGKREGFVKRYRNYKSIPVQLMQIIIIQCVG